MIILGIDPGSRHTGYGLLTAHRRELKAVEFGRFTCPAQQDVAPRLAYLCDELADLLERWNPDTAVLETPFHGLNSRSLVVLAQARGALLAVLGQRGIEIREYSPAEVKSAVAGSGRAGKAEMARMVRLQLGLPEEPRSSDAADALALALCFAHRERFDNVTRAASDAKQKA